MQGYYLPNELFQGFSSDNVERSENLSCIRCPGNCLCDKNGKCLIDEQIEDSMESLLRVTIGAILSVCILCCFVLAFIVFRQRKCKVSGSKRYFLNASSLTMI